MARVMINCPKTNKPIFTGIATDKTSFESSNIENNTIRCQHCKDKHKYSKKDCYLEE